MHCVEMETRIAETNGQIMELIGEKEEVSRKNLELQKNVEVLSSRDSGLLDGLQEKILSLQTAFIKQEVVQNYSGRF